MEENSFLVRVITNQAGMYALWALCQKTPPGWWETGRSGTTEECLAFIDARTKPRPLQQRYTTKLESCRVP